MSHSKADKQKFLTVLKAKDFNISKACIAFKITRETFYQWKKEDWFAETIKELEEAEIDEAEELHRIVRCGIPKKDKKGKIIGWKQRPDAKAIEFYLERKGKDRGFVKRVEKTGKGGVPLNPAKLIPIPMSKKQAKKFLNDLDGSV